MKILWVSNAPWAHTGYGNQTRLFVPRLQAMGHTIDILANYGLAGAMLKIDGQTRVFPPGTDPNCNDVIAPYARHCEADIVLTLYDTWTYNPAVMERVRWCPWMPVDHDPLPTRVADAIRPAWQPIAYSMFGKAKLEEAGFKPLYVPHGIDTHVFAPNPVARAAGRKLLGVSDSTFVAIMVAANKGTPSRKSFSEAILAFTKFHKEHSDSFLYLHTQANTRMGGLDLPALVAKAGLDNKAVAYADLFYEGLGFPDEYMVNMYNAADVLLSPSMGEGFGIPIVEAQACGCPVIVGGYTSMPELCWSGWRVGGQPFYTPLDSWQFIPDIGEITTALRKAYKRKGSEPWAQMARAKALDYDADTVAERYWKPALAAIEASLAVKAETTGAIG